MKIYCTRNELNRAIYNAKVDTDEKQLNVEEDLPLLILS